MKNIFNKIGQVLQLLLSAPVKLPGKVGNVLKYLALGLGIVETVLDDGRSQPEENGKEPPLEGSGKKPASELPDRTTGPEEEDRKPAAGLVNDKHPPESPRDSKFAKDWGYDTTERSADDESE